MADDEIEYGGSPTGIMTKRALGMISDRLLYRR